MTTIPQPTVTMADLIEWDKCKKELAVLKSKEALLRQRIYNHYFPNPTEGTNKTGLEQGYILKLVQGIDRKFDVGALQAAASEGGLFHKQGFDANPLVNWVPELKLREYRALTEEQRILLDNVLIIKKSSPQMEIVLPAAAAKAAKAAK